jgi:DNA topoisomerase-3
MEGAGKLVDDEELREAMAERGLGTPATRAQVIEGLLFEGYLIRQGRDLIVTAKGISLITLLRNLHAEALTKPELTGEWEHKLRQMERGELSRNTFMTEIRGLTTEIVGKVRGGMGQEVRGNYKSISAKCPRCGNETFKESFKAYECTNPECKLIVWKTMNGREFEREEVAKLLNEGHVGPLEGFRSKLGRAFNAEIILNEKTEWKQKFNFEDDEGGEGGGSGKAVDLSQAKDLGETPHGHVYETETAYLCVPPKAGAKPIRMGKSICQRPIPPEQAVKIFRDGKSDLLPRFISKKGKPFAAYLVLEGTKVGFEFEPRKPKEPAAKKIAESEPAKGEPAKSEPAKKAPVKKAPAKATSA